MKSNDRLSMFFLKPLDKRSFPGRPRKRWLELSERNNCRAVGDTKRSSIRFLSNNNRTYKGTVNQADT